MYGCLKREQSKRGERRIWDTKTKQERHFKYLGSVLIRYEKRDTQIRKLNAFQKQKRKFDRNNEKSAQMLYNMDPVL